jgi:hypothetical protein
MPTPLEFIANTYECTNCHNKVNDRKPLPDKCPWCGEDMKGGDNNV